jgi:putative ABC transport system permease protein
VGWLRRIRSTIVGNRLDRTLDEEMRFHLDERTDDFVRAGMTREEARRAALRRFGNAALVKERARDADTVRWLADLGRDVRYAIRTLRRSPEFACAAVLTLALGIGANTAVFSLINSLLLRALPVPDPERLVAVSGGGFTGSTWSYAVWDAIRPRAELFDGAFAYTDTNRLNLFQSGGETQTVDALFVSGDFFKTLRVPPLIGRTFVPDDDVRGREPVAVISYGLWQTRFAGAAGIVGTPLVVEGVPYSVVGVTPAGFFGVEVGRRFDVALPIGTEPLVRGKDTRLDNRGSAFLQVMLRLKPGQSIEAATTALRGEQPQIRAAAMPQQWPPRFQQLFLKEPLTLVPAGAGSSGLRPQYRRPLVIILSVTGLVLLIACANIANLMLARTIARQHELSVRHALGATRWRVARQLIVESLVLASAGAVVALAVAAWGSRAIASQVSTSMGRVVLDLSLDWRVTAFTAAATIASVLLFGVVPAFRASRMEPIDAMKQRGDGGRRSNVSSALVVVQVALSLVLIVAAGLFIRTFEGLTHVPLGFDRDRVLVVNLNVARARVDSGDRLALYRRLIDSVHAVPGVASAAASIVTPVGGNGLIDVVNPPGVEPTLELFAAPGRPSDRTALVNLVTPGWFASYGLAIRSGRDIDENDTATAPPVVVVNETFARRFFPNQAALGQRFAGLTALQKTIVGVVGDSVYGSLRDAVPPTMYAPLAQMTSGPPAEISIGVRSSAERPAALVPAVAAALKAVDRDVTFSFRPLADQVDASITRERLVAILSGFFGLLALLLAAVGVYGVTAYTVGRRRLEMGIRTALGARPADILRLFAIRIVSLVALGVFIGGMVSLWASRFIATLLYGLEPHDLSTFAAAAGVLAAVGVAAAWVPAWRASRIDAAEVLRSA